LRYVKSELDKPLSEFTPYVSVIAPCRGLDQDLKENLIKLFVQDYPGYEIVFVTDSETDKSIAVIKELQKDFLHIDSKIIIAGQAKESGQKVHNLREAIKHTKGDVFVFVDSDARPNEKWLKNLVAPLKDESIGAVTGYRWFFSSKGNFVSEFRSVWNASITSQLGANTKKNFCWGGSTAIRRKTFEKLNMTEQWRGTLSDDFALTRALQSKSLPIHFAPRCLTASIEDCGFSELLEFTTRQMKITRVYAPHLWKAALIGSILFVGSFYVGTVLVIVRVLIGISFVLPLAIVLLLFVLGVGKAWVRWHAVTLVLTDYKTELRRSFLPQIILWFLGSGLYLYNCIAAGFSQLIVWRGIKYELKSPTETVIMSPSQKKTDCIQEK